MPELIATLNANSADFAQQLQQKRQINSQTKSDIDSTVAEIIAQVSRRGDLALLEYTNRFDNTTFVSPDQLEIAATDIASAIDKITPTEALALQTAAERIQNYASKQKLQSWQYTEADGTQLGQKVTPLDSVGVYVPGGKAAYPSSVLMNAIPAKVAGVGQITMACPTPNGAINPLVLAAASIAKVDKVFAVGGAQAIAALAYGTQTIAAVDKIVGPGNVYVASAKKMVFGKVGIDMVAGPSEIVIICDGKTDPDWIAMDMFAQAEHDENAQSILITADPDFVGKVAASIARLLPQMERRAIIRQSLANKGALIQASSLAQAAEIANTIAPEHLELSVADPAALAEHIRHAGAIFMGRYSGEVLGDYCAGPSHVLPTSGSARFYSPLGVYDFQKRTSIINCSQAAAATLGKTAVTLATGEGFTAHARSAQYRM